MITEDEWLAELALECTSCPRCWERPCAACQVGGVCDGPMCRCLEREQDLAEVDDDHDHSEET